MSNNDIFSNEKLIIERMEIPVNFKEAPWGAYMEENYDGIYEKFIQRRKVVDTFCH